jgi:hypothetical protein
MESGKRSVKYQRLFTNARDDRLVTLGKKTDQDRVNEEEDDEEAKELPKRKGILAKGTRTNQIVLDEIKLANINNTDQEENGDEDIDFQGLGLRKYLEKKNVMSVERPDYGVDKMGKRSKMEYVKNLAYFHEEMNKLGDRKVIKESERRLYQREIEEQVRKEVKKELEGEGEENDSIYVDKSEDSFQRKKSNYRELM